jgi:hypothetical protein
VGNRLVQVKGFRSMCVIDAFFTDAAKVDVQDLCLDLEILSLAILR